MKSIAITDVGLPVKLFAMGLLNYLDSKEVKFYITDMCYRSNSKHNIPSIHEREFAKRLISRGILEVVSLSESQMARVSELYKIYKPKFVSTSVSALVLAEVTGCRLISENTLLREVASTELGIRANDKYWCVKDLLDEIRVRGIHLDFELVTELL